MYQSGTVCSNYGIPSSGMEITFKSDGTYSTTTGYGTWSYDSSTAKVTRSDSSSFSEVIYYNKPQIPWSSVVTTPGSQIPTLYWNYDQSLGSANGSCQYYEYIQQRMRKL